MKQMNLKQKGKQGGFTLVELMVGIIILSILGAVFFVTTNTDKSKATALFANVTKGGSALQLSKADLPCYPKRMDVLNLKAQALAANMFCGVDSTTVWRGPYLTGAAFDAAGNLDFGALVPTSVGTISTAPNAANGTNDWFITISKLPSTIENELMAACGAVKCISTAPVATATTWTVKYKFDETR